jgi:hypothetical protein
MRRLIEELKAEGGIDSAGARPALERRRSLERGVGLVNLFGKGPVVQLRRPVDRGLESEDSGVAYDGPLTILVDHQRVGVEISRPQCRTTGATSGRKCVKAPAEPLPARPLRAWPDPGYGQLTVTIGIAAYG